MAMERAAHWMRRAMVLPRKRLQAQQAVDAVVFSEEGGLHWNCDLTPGK